MLNRPLKWVFGLSAGIVVSSALLSAITSFFPSSVMTSYDEALKDRGLGTEFLDQLEHENIVVYDHGNPLVPFHLASLNVWNYPLILEEGFKLLYGEGYASHYGFALLFPGEEGICLIYAPEKSEALTMISDMSGLPQEHLTSLDAADLFYDFIYRHEAAHCDGYGEIGADMFAVRSLDVEHPARDIKQLIKYIRAVAPFSQLERKGMYEQYEIALEHEHAEQGRMYIGDHVPNANQKLHQIIEENVQVQDGEEYFQAVYRTLKSMLDDHQIYGRLTRRAAELYVEGVEFLTETVEKLEPVAEVNPIDRKTVFGV